MPEYFVDTWLLVAALDRHDEHHATARRIGQRLANAKLVTHDAVFTELLAFVSTAGRHMRRVAVDAIRDARRRWTVIPAERSLFDRGLLLYADRLDKEWSHVDCMSMVLMEERNIRHILTNDHHFTQAGFTLVNE